LLTGVLVAAFCAYQAASESQQTSKPIEQLRVGQKVRTEAPREALTAAEGELSHLLVHDEPTVDPATWKLVRLRAEQRWDDGTLDDINVETLQPPEWLAEHKVRVGGEVPLPLDLVEMGLPIDLQAKVLAIERCPPLETGPGRTVLTTVNHLNRDVVELTIRDAQGREETIRPTGLHKFYSATRDDWLSATDLETGEQLDGLDGRVTVTGHCHLPGTQRVYNMTVEGEHVYRVAGLGVLVHNNGCDSRTIFRALSESDMISLMNGQRIMPRGVVRDIEAQVKGMPTKYISASQTLEGARRFQSTAPIVEIDVNKLVRSGSGVVDHKNVLQALRDLKDITNAKRASEVLIKNGIDPGAIVRIIF
jgi:hypothetical protein